MKSTSIHYKKQSVHIFSGICAFFICSLAFAEDKPSALNSSSLPSASGSIFTMFFGLCVVLGIMAGIAWLVKRSGLTSAGRNGVPMKVVAGLSIGTRERVIVVEVADEWLVLGVTPSNIRTLTTLPKQELAPSNETTSSVNFAAWLKQTIEKRK